jgi:hypothetical protein
MSAGHILVVEDDIKVRTLLRRCLQGEGFAVSEAADGAELVACLKKQPVSLITLDLNLGKDNGLDLVRVIRKDHNVPIWRLGQTTTLPSRSSFGSWSLVSEQSCGGQHPRKRPSAHTADICSKAGYWTSIVAAFSARASTARIGNSRPASSICWRHSSNAHIACCHATTSWIY